jgi:hypothetical protein
VLANVSNCDNSASYILIKYNQNALETAFIPDDMRDRLMAALIKGYQKTFVQRIIMGGVYVVAPHKHPPFNRFE